MFTRLWRRPGNRTHATSRGPGCKMSTRRLGLERLEDRCLLSGDLVFRWTGLLQQALRVPGAQPPTVFQTRSFATLHTAMFDAVNAIERSYTPYFAQIDAPRGASAEAAAAQAARDVLTALYPAQRDTFDQALAADLEGIPPDRARQGVDVGQAVAQQIVEWRRADRWDVTPPRYDPGYGPGIWEPTPPGFSPATFTHYGQVVPFAIEGPAQFRPPPPPALTSELYTHDFNEAKQIGRVDSASRTADQTVVARLWAGVQPGVTTTGGVVWYQVAEDVARARGTTLAESARLFALMSISSHDGLQTSFDSKYHYGLWRPVTAIRRADEDDNSATEPDATWGSLIVNPPYPTYAGNMATSGAAYATVLARFFGSNDIPIEARWQGPSGVTRAHPGFWSLADEQARSRVYGGIHFTFDSVAGQGIGQGVADYVFENFLLPRTAVEGVVINDGSAQRSRVSSITVTFSGPVTVGDGAFELRRQDGSLVGLAVALSEVGGKTVAVLTFTGADIIAGSLADGNYTLTIQADRVRDGAGRPVDGDDDGRLGGDRVDHFFRLYGDSDGDRDVDLADTARFLGAFGSRRGEPRYLDYLDYNGDDRIWLADLEAFLDRLGSRLDP